MYPVMTVSTSGTTAGRRVRTSRAARPTHDWRHWRDLQGWGEDYSEIRVTRPMQVAQIKARGKCRRLSSGQRTTSEFRPCALDLGPPPTPTLARGMCPESGPVRRVFFHKAWRSSVQVVLQCHCRRLVRGTPWLPRRFGWNAASSRSSSCRRSNGISRNRASVWPTPTVDKNSKFLRHNLSDAINSDCARAAIRPGQMKLPIHKRGRKGQSN